MSLIVLRVILLIVFAIGLKVLCKGKISSWAKLIGVILLFPMVLATVSFALQFATIGLASNAQFISVIHAIYAAVAEVLMVVGYCLLFNIMVDETTAVQGILKKRPRWVLVTSGVMIIILACVLYAKNMAAASIASSVPQIMEDGIFSLLDVLTNFVSLAVYNYICHGFRIAVMVIMLIGCKGERK